MRISGLLVDGRVFNVGAGGAFWTGELDTRGTADTADPDKVGAEGRRVEVRAADVLPLGPTVVQALLLDDAKGTVAGLVVSTCAFFGTVGVNVSFATNLFRVSSSSCISFMVFFVIGCFKGVVQTWVDGEV